MQTTMMTLQEVRERVAEIERIQDNNEAAHTAEDDLYHDVLESLAHCKDRYARRLAAEALKSQKIAFGRWCR